MDITATLGPVSLAKGPRLELEKRVSRFRLNSGHLNANELRSILKDLNGKIPIVIDLQGSKVRIGQFIDVKELPQEVKIVNENSSSDVNFIPVPDQQFFKALKVKDRLYLNDAKIELEITSVGSKDINTVVVRNGELASFKSINRKDHPIHFVKVSDADKKAIGASIKYDLIQYAVSFIHNGEEAKLFRPLVKHKRLIAKIERPQAMQYLQNIDRNFDELWFCRGDMGSQAGLEKLMDLQAQFVMQFPKLFKPKFIAGRLLWSMVNGPVPAKSELEHLYEVKRSGFDGIVLSDETAVGKYPLKVLDLLKDVFSI